MVFNCRSHWQLTSVMGGRFDPEHRHKTGESQQSSKPQGIKPHFISHRDSVRFCVPASRRVLTGKQIGRQRFRCSAGKSNGSRPYRLTVSVCDDVTDNTHSPWVSDGSVGVSSCDGNISDVISQPGRMNICYFVFYFHCNQASGSFIVI